MIKYRNLILTISTFALFLLLSVPVLAQSIPSLSDKYDDRSDIGQYSTSNSSLGTDARMQNNPALVNTTSPSGVNTTPSTVYSSSPTEVHPSNPAGVDQTNPTGGTGGSSGY